MAARAYNVLFAAAAVAAYNNGLSPAAPRGWATWCTDDFCGLFDYCSESEVQSIADALVSSGLRDLGYSTVLLDDCWASTNRTASGDLQPDPTRFPSGIPALVQYLSARNLTLGLYTCAGVKTCKYGRTGSGGHFQQDAQWFARMGVSYVKMDWCGHPDNQTAQEVYGNFSAALNATGHSMWFGTCEWGEDNVWEWGASVAQQFRIAADHLPFWSIQAGGAGAGDGQGVIDYINWMANLTAPPVAFKNQPWGYADMDFLMTGFPTLSNSESEVEFAMWTLMGVPLLVATDVRNMSAWKAGLLGNTDALAIHNDSLGATATRIFNDPVANAQVWSRPLANGDIAVVLINAAAFQEQPVGVAWSQLGWNAADAVRVYDVLAHNVINPALTDGYAPLLQPHACAYLRLARVSS